LVHSLISLSPGIQIRNLPIEWFPSSQLFPTEGFYEPLPLFSENLLKIPFVFNEINLASSYWQQMRPLSTLSDDLSNSVVVASSLSEYFCLRKRHGVDVWLSAIGRFPSSIVQFSPELCNVIGIRQLYKIPEDHFLVSYLKRQKVHWTIELGFFVFCTHVERSFVYEDFNQRISISFKKIDKTDPGNLVRLVHVVDRFIVWSVGGEIRLFPRNDLFTALSVLFFSRTDKAWRTRLSLPQDWDFHDVTGANIDFHSLMGLSFKCFSAFNNGIIFYDNDSGNGPLTVIRINTTTNLFAVFFSMLPTHDPNTFRMRVPPVRIASDIRRDHATYGQKYMCLYDRMNPVRTDFITAWIKCG